MLSDVITHLYYLPENESLENNSQTLDLCKEYANIIGTIVGEYLSSLSQGHAGDIRLSTGDHITIARLSGEYLVLKGLLISQSHSIGTLFVPTILWQVQRMSSIATTLRKELYKKYS